MQLGSRSRTILAAAGAALAVEAFSLLPLYGSSTVAVEDLAPTRDSGERSAHLDRLKSQLSHVDDPFAHPLPEDHSVTSPRSPLRPRVTGVRLRAIVAGKERLALIDDGSSRIVGAGDSIEGVRIVQIGLDDIRLADGHVLRLDESAR
jgi:hypothetical protein